MSGIEHDINSSASSDGQQILLTGATGYLGAFLLYELLAGTARKVNCLVRAVDEERAWQRVRENLVHYQRWDEAMADRITVTRGDLALPLLGLGEKEFAGLAGATDVILHNGALVNYLFPLPRMRAVNVDGTLSLIRLARMSPAPKQLHYVSVNSLDPISPYGRSKLEAEEMVRGAAADHLPACVYKISRLAPDSRTGLSNKNDILIRMLDIILQIGYAPSIEFSEDWVSVDIAARAIVETALRSPAGQAFPLRPRGYNSFSYLLEVGRENGFQIKTEPLADWIRRVRATGSPEYELTIRALRLDDAPAWLDDEPGMPVSEDDGQEGFPASVLEVPEVGRTALDRYFERRRLDGPPSRGRPSTGRPGRR